MLRIFKVVAALLIAMIGLLHFIGNLANLEAAHGFVALVLSGADQPFYQMPGPAITAQWLRWVVLAVILGCELAVGVLGITGALLMLKQLRAPALDFSRASRFALLAGAMGMFTWFGIFIVIGEGYFHIWQAAAGAGPIAGAMRYGTVCAFLMFFIALVDE